ncbi:olfactory receptor 14A16-like [Erinaceus europaeus]|uniref:Olfactory receptor n=1 Tax=Erinaceus europaeus TaxID=9365 RepID=A0A1S3AP57_ERIEU|nr:olfactory receptor 14A16-like [Erinaceus europaeus]
MAKMINHTKVTEFLLLGLSDDPSVQTLVAVFFLLAYLAALLGNGLISFLITCDPHLHAPMYFLLKNLSFIDLCFISTTVPNFVLNSLTGRDIISFMGCIFQVFLFISFASAEMAILTVMSYDRYVAICHPLHYEVIMHRAVCVKMAVAVYLSAGLSGTMHTIATFSTGFSSNEIHCFFCDIPQLLLISEPKVNITEMSVTVLTASTSLICFVCILYSYVHIFSAVLRVSSKDGRSKALSTCLPHLAVVTLFISTGAVAYLKPTSDQLSTADIILSVFYNVVPPSMNPIIYSLRNKDLKMSLGKMLGIIAFKST